MNAVAYPRLIKRVRALLIDSLLIPVAAIGTLIAGDALGVSNTLGKLLLICVPIFILEPVLVAFTGGTIGHHLQKIRVTKMDGASHINLFAATVRFIVKLLLGWLSFILVFTTAKHQAVHDLIAGSVVIHKDNSNLPAFELLDERVPDNDAYPSRLRRTAIIVAYIFLGYVLVSVVLVSAWSPACMELNQCTALDQTILNGLTLLWLISIAAIIVLGWKGKLYGCRKRKPDA